GLAGRGTVARGAPFGLHRASLTQLAVRLAAAEMARLGVAPATALGAEAVAARVSFEALQERALAYFAPVARFPGFARALAATLGELRLGRVASRDAQDGAARDVAELARCFDRPLVGAKPADRGAAVASHAAGGWGARRRPLLLGTRRGTRDRRDRTTPPRRGTGRNALRRDGGAFARARRLHVAARGGAAEGRHSRLVRSRHVPA